MNISGGSEYACVDDLMRAAICGLFQSGSKFEATRGEGIEVLGAAFCLTNPRARISRSEMRGKIYSALGELFWYLSGTADLSFISYYLSAYEKESDDGVTVSGAYGPRLFGAYEHNQNQVSSVIKLLRQKQSSRRAVIQLLSASDVANDSKSTPCTCSLQFIVRGESLHMVAYLRSNDAYIGLPHDVFVFTMIQEMVARALGVGLGMYYHFVGSLHLYERNKASARLYLSEGYQTTEPMPEMPPGDPFENMSELLKMEQDIRTGHVDLDLNHLEDYWSDIAKMLLIYSRKKCKQDGYVEDIQSIKDKLKNSVYRIYISD